MPAGFNLLPQRYVKGAARHNAARFRNQARGNVPALRRPLLRVGDAEPPAADPTRHKNAIASRPARAPIDFTLLSDFDLLSFARQVNPAWR